MSSSSSSRSEGSWGSMVWRWVGSGTSPVDWCEDNYTISPHIAEFFNTLSNVLFIVVPVGASRLWHSYSRNVSRGVHAVWVLFVVVGLSSAYFHATLSLLGQLLDELSILWVLMLSYTLFTPLRYRPRPLRDRFRLYPGCMALLAAVITASAFVKPAINAYALFLVGAPAVWMLVAEVRASKNSEVSRLGVRTLAALAVAALAWVFDRFLCWVWRALHVPILHGLWHLLIFVTAYGMQVLFCYFHAAQDVPESRPALRYWPEGTFALPYVLCHAKRHVKSP